MKLSNNFTLSELTRSNTAIKTSIDNTPNEYHIINLKLLCVNVLQPIRDKFGVVTVTSGYRSERLNRVIGGSTSSQHKKGQAADIFFDKIDKSCFDWIASNIDYDQLIYECGDDNKPEWIHVSFNYIHNRKEVLRYDKTKGYYKY